MLPDGLILACAALVGAVIGSFLNVCICRLPAGESVVRPRSHCPACGTTIAWYDNIPVLSWVLLRARCRSCGARISVQYPLVELATALLWLWAAARFGASLEASRVAVFLTLLLGIALVDARHFVIPDHFSLGGAALGILASFAPGAISPLHAIAGAGVGYGLLKLVEVGGEKVFRKPALGLGDVHMMAMVGAFLGIPGVLLTLFLGSLLGLVIGVPVAWVRGRLAVMGTYLPLGTFLAMGAAVSEAWGPLLVAWYLRSFLGG